MNPHSTALLALVALALGAFIWFYEIEGEAERARAAEADKQLFAGLEDSSIEWIALETTDDVAARAERRDGRWWLTSPFEFPADAVALDAMAGALADLTHEQAIESDQPLSVYGLGEGAQRVEFGTSGDRYALRIGNKAPLGSNTYVARGADDAVFTVPTWRTNALSDELLELRDRRVLAFDLPSVRRITASWPGGRVVAERDGEGWRLREPLDGPADRDRIEALLSDLTYLRTDGFVDEPLDDEQAGLDPPDFAVSLELSSDVPDGATRTIRFELGQVWREEQRLARGSHETLYALASDRIGDFPRELVEYRDRELARFVSSEAALLELVFAPEGADEASVRVEARREGDRWTSQPALRDGAAGDLVATLAHLKAGVILADASGEAELAGLGLAPATTRIRVLGRPGAPDDSPKVLAEVLLGHFDPRRGIVAMRPGRDEVFRLEPSLIESLPRDSADFESRFVAPAEATEEPVAEEAAD